MTMVPTFEQVQRESATFSMMRTLYRWSHGSVECHRQCACSWCYALNACGTGSTGFWCPIDRGPTSWRILWLKTSHSVYYARRCGSLRRLLAGILMLVGGLVMLTGLLDGIWLTRSLW
jgi:hypothetical protein